MKIAKNEVSSIIVFKDGEVVAVISDTEIIEKDGYEVITEPVK